MTDLNLVSFSPKSDGATRIRPPKSTNVPVCYHSGGAPLAKRSQVTAPVRRVTDVQTTAALTQAYVDGGAVITELSGAPGTTFVSGGAVTLPPAFFNPRCVLLTLPTNDLLVSTTRNWTLPTGADMIQYLKDQGEPCTAGVYFSIPLKVLFANSESLTFTSAAGFTISGNNLFGLDIPNPLPAPPFDPFTKDLSKLHVYIEDPITPQLRAWFQ